MAHIAAAVTIIAAAVTIVWLLHTQYGAPRVPRRNMVTAPQYAAVTIVWLLKPQYGAPLFPAPHPTGAGCSSRGPGSRAYFGRGPGPRPGATRQLNLGGPSPRGQRSLPYLPLGYRSHPRGNPSQGSLQRDVPHIPLGYRGNPAQGRAVGERAPISLPSQREPCPRGSRGKQAQRPGLSAEACPISRWGTETKRETQIPGEPCEAGRAVGSRQAQRPGLSTLQVNPAGDCRRSARAAFRRHGGAVAPHSADSGFRIRRRGRGG